MTASKRVTKKSLLRLRLFHISIYFLFNCTKDDLLDRAGMLELSRYWTSCRCCGKKPSSPKWQSKRMQSFKQRLAQWISCRFSFTPFPVDMVSLCILFATKETKDIDDSWYALHDGLQWTPLEGTVRVRVRDFRRSHGGSSECQWITIA